MSGNAPVTRSEVAVTTQRSLLLSLVATASVAVVPTFFAFAVLVFSQPEPMILAAIALSIVLTAGAVIAGSAIWARQPESAGVSFGDLMLWSWIRQYQAERTLYDATATLGFDRSGRFLGHSTASDEEQISAMRAIAKALDAKSTYTLGHSARVAKHARRVASELNLTDERSRALVLAAELHDVGNIALSDDILRKAGNLTVEERAEMEAHVLLGARMVEKAGSAEVVEGIRHHHERWDGDGYPVHLRGHQIPSFARIIAIAEAYDAMTSTRPYRQSFSKQHAIDVLRAESGTQFDGELVEAFISTLRKPLPLVARFPFLAAIQRQLRELALVFKRIGAVAVSATASTIAIALILGSTVLSPGTPEDAVPELAERRRNVEPIDRVLGERITDPADALAALSEAVAGPSSNATTDEVLGVRVAEDVRVASIEGPEVGFGDGLAGDGTPPGDGGQNPPGGGGGGEGPPGESGDGDGAPPPGDGGTNNPDGGGSEPPPGGGSDTTPPSDGGSGDTATPPSGGNGSDPGGGEDKNPNANGNGHSNENAPGHDENGPGNSENAPGHNKDEGGPSNSDQAPGRSEEAPGRSEDAPGRAEDAPGRSEDAPGRSKDDD